MPREAFLENRKLGYSLEFRTAEVKASANRRKKKPRKGEWRRESAGGKRKEMQEEVDRWRRIASKGSWGKSGTSLLLRKTAGLSLFFLTECSPGVARGGTRNHYRRQRQ